MELKEYQGKAKQTAIYPKHAEVLYPLLGLTGEVGELANKLKKLYRDHEASEISIHTIPHNMMQELEGEMGDILWYWSILCKDLSLDVNKVAQKNVDKLKSRMERGKIKGSGDER